MFDRRLLTHFDWVLLFLVCLIAGVGILNLYSATSSWESGLTPILARLLRQGALNPACRPHSGRDWQT